MESNNSSASTGYSTYTIGFTGIFAALLDVFGISTASVLVSVRCGAPSRHSEIMATTFASLERARRMAEQNPFAYRKDIPPEPGLTDRS